MLCQNTCDVPFGITAIVVVPGAAPPPALHAGASVSSASASSARLIEPPEPGGVATENGVALRRRQTRDPIEHDVRRTAVARGDRTHWPVGSDHQPICAKAFARDVEVRL